MDFPELPGEKGRWHDLLVKHADRLLEQARDSDDSDPDLDVVGMIITPDAVKIPLFREALERSEGGAVLTEDLVGVVPRQIILGFIRAADPAALDWLEPISHGVHRSLPLFLATGDGMRLGAMDFEVIDL